MSTQKYIDKMMKYYNETLPFLHDLEKEEWLYLLQDVLPRMGDLEDYDARYIIGAMYYILTTDKSYTEEEQEDYFRHIRVYSRLDEVVDIAYKLVDLLVDEDEASMDEEALHQLIDVLKASNLDGVIAYDRSFNMEELYKLQENHPVDANKIKYLEQLFFEGNLNKSKYALDIAYSILLAEPYAYHVLIFVMDRVVHDGITSTSIGFLEAFIHSFEQVEEDWIKSPEKDLSIPSDLREYCFGLSSVAMFYLEEENYEKAIKYYEKLIAIDQENLFHGKEYILRAYMFDNQFDKYSDTLDALPEQSVYKRLLLLYRKIQLEEEDMDSYLEDTIKHFGYLLKIIVEKKEVDLSTLPEIEEDFLIEYGSLFEEDEHVLEVIKKSLEKTAYIA